MPRFYFNFQDGSSRLDDEEGMVLPDAEAAWYQAYRSVRELIRDDIWRGGPSGGRFVEIKDEEGYPLWAMPFDEVAGAAA